MTNFTKRVLTLLMVCLPLTLFADDFFDDFAEEEGGASSNLEVNGTVDLGLRTYFADDIKEDAPDVDANASLTLKYTGSMADITVTTLLDKESIDLDECYANIYSDYFNVEAGYLKTVWGKGDKLHVVDLLNPTDYSKYFINDYLENKIAQPTLKVNVPLGASGLVELAYIPVFQGDVVPTDGRWAPAEAAMLKSTVTGIVKAKAEAAYKAAYEKAYTDAYTAAYTAAYTSALAGGKGPIEAGIAAINAATPLATGAASGAASAASLEVLQAGSDMSQYYQDTNQLSFGQFGFRTTASVAGFDLGALYYFGYNKQPNLNLAKMKLEYEQMQMVGIELGKALFGFNLRAEGAYYIMKDSDNSLNYLAGFDYNLPLHNINLNLQLKGNYMLDSDVDNANMVVGKLSDTFNHEKVSLSVTGIYNIEDEDYMIKPEFSTTIGDTVKLEVASVIFADKKETILGQYDKNDYVSINVNYMF